MKCILCENDARAICKFCGRAVCEKHIAEQRFVSGYTSVGGFLAVTDNGVSVEKAVWCRQCQPEFHRTT